MPSDLLQQLLSKLENVRPSRHGITARCPAHDDHHPSLSIRDGEDGRVLLHCFASCSKADICAALGIRVSDLFSDSPRRSSPHVEVPPKPVRLDWRGYSHQILWFAEERWLRGERIFAAAKGKDISDWSGNDLDHAWEFVYSAFCDSEEGERLEDLAVKIRDL